MSSREIISRLNREGWFLHRTSGSHHIFKHPQKPDALVVVPHPKKDMPKGTLASIMRSAGWR
ncbi:MAG: type II toxin-antitoxin system HicA family toxin [Burkholderiales bacterium]|nr:type II toxin-antitoxin system HicA family toxin [Phycisphaerae bacterium]